MDSHRKAIGVANAVAMAEAFAQALPSDLLGPVIKAASRVAAKTEDPVKRELIGLISDALQTRKGVAGSAVAKRIAKESGSISDDSDGFAIPFRMPRTYQNAGYSGSNDNPIDPQTVADQARSPQEIPPQAYFTAEDLARVGLGGAGVRVPINSQQAEVERLGRGPAPRK